MRALIRSFEMLIKDNALVQREVMREYDTKVRQTMTSLPNAVFLPPPQFVNPRIHPVRRDVGVMTNEAEIVGI